MGVEWRGQGGPQYLDVFGDAHPVPRVHLHRRQLDDEGEQGEHHVNPSALAHPRHAQDVEQHRGQQAQHLDDHRPVVAHVLCHVALG